MKNYYKQYRSWSDYIYSNNVLKNKYNIKKRNVLELLEYNKTSKLLINVLKSNIEINRFKDYCNLHYQLFKDIYDWAGHIRTVNMFKYGLGNLPSNFLNCDLIKGEGEKVFEDLKNINNFNDNFYYNMTDLFFKLNHIHPFREGNGRVQKLFLQILAIKNNKFLQYDKLNIDVINNLSSAYELSLENLIKNPEVIYTEMVDVFKLITIDI